MSLSRRDVLKGFSLGAGSLLLGPILQRLQAQANGESRLPRRFVFVLQNNGFQPWAAQPKGIERGRTAPDRVREVPLAAHDLPEDLAPLTPFKDRVTIVQRLSGAHAVPNHGAGFAALSGSGRAKREPLAETIDAALARAFPGVFPLLSLGVATGNRGNAEPQGPPVEYVCSAWGPRRPIPTQTRPDLAYKTLFGSVASGNARQDFDARAQLLDFMKEDVRQVSSRLVGAEKEKFDYYLHAFESLGDRMTGLNRMAPALRRHAPTPNANYAPAASEAQRLEAHFELAGAALISGLTNVATIISGMGRIGGYFCGIGMDEIGLHPLGHGANDQRTNQQLYTLLRRFHLTQIAGLVRKLSAVPEGDGNMMDNTVIVYTSDTAHAHHSDGTEWPFVLVGSLGKRLRTGRFVEYPGPGQAGNRTLNALYCTLLHAAGAPRDHFNLEGGIKEVDRPGPLSELLT